VPTNYIEAGSGAFQNQGAFLYPGVLIAKKKPDQRTLPMRQDLKRGRYIHLCSANARSLLRTTHRK
jgi:hypothetical protein